MVTIVQDTQPIVQETTNEGLRNVIVYIGGFFTLILFIVFVLFIIMMIIMKINDKIKEFNRKRKDFLYYNFEENSQFCHNNRDYIMKRRRKRTFFLTWKRAPIFVQNDLEGLKQIGEYNGETFKKEGFYLVSVYNKLHMFKVIETIIIIPLALKERIVKKVEIDGKRAMILDCEGLDEVGSTDYYMIPLIKDSKDKNKFIDFSDMIRKEFTEKIIYRDEIKELLQQSKDSTIKAVESNPNVQMKRRTQ